MRLRKGAYIGIEVNINSDGSSSGNDGTNRGHVDGGEIPIAVKCGDWIATSIDGRREVVKDCCWAGNRPVRPPEASDCHWAQAHVIDDKCTITASLLVRRADDNPIEINLQWIHGDEWSRTDAHTSQSNGLGGGISGYTIDSEKIY